MKTRIIQNEPEPPATPAEKSRRSTNIAGRMGRWSAHHRKIAIFGWLAFVLAAFAIGMFVVGTKTATSASGPGESGRMDKILEDGFKQPAGESVLIQSQALTTEDPAFQKAIRDVVANVSKLPTVINVRSPLNPENSGQISGDSHSALVDFQIRGEADEAVNKIDPIIAAVDQAKAAHPQLFIGQFGDGSADKQLEAAFMSDLGKAGLYSVPVTLIILILAFGALIAAGIPLLLALTAVFATFGLWAIPSHVLPSDESIYAIVLLIGLAVGVDYSLFYLKRERE